jgi:ketosteroid isomerase-like protein
MPDDHVALATAFMEAMNSGDTQGVLDLVDPEIRFEPLRASTEGAFLGHEGMRRFMEDTRETFDLFEGSLSETIPVDDRAVGVGTIRIRGRESGIETDIPFAAVVRYRDGLMVEYKDYGDRAKALEAVGLA